MKEFLKFYGSVLVLSLFTMASHAVASQLLPGHIPAAVSQLKSVGRLPGTTKLQLAIGLPLRNQGALTKLLTQIYDPSSPQYRHYLTPDEFTRQFGPVEADYEAVAAFANANGLQVTTRHSNRMLIDVTGSVADIERTFHVTMRVYQHPTEHRTFYAPDQEPSLDLTVPILRISGLDNYSLPRPRLHAAQTVQSTAASPLLGSGPGGTYMGNDFRAAYALGTSLRGTGQTVGLLQFDGYTPGDISNYEAAAGLPSVTLSNVLIDGFSGLPSYGDEVEVSLDIEMAISMAPGLSQVILYEAPNPSPFEDILNRMVTDNAAKQLSCSWYVPGGGPDPLADQIFQQMAAQGQSFLSASGDFDAWAGPIDFPDESPYITIVGGTTLTTAFPGGPWVSETVWNWNNGNGSGGGISTRYSIPSWQTSVSMANNQGSVTMRNVPDVALTADNIYVRADGIDYVVGGTSCAAPLWAGFTALLNQQAMVYGMSPAGFLNPTLYQIGTIGNYASSFHDITNGNNTSVSSPNAFFAVPGYDLCTGWGTPAGKGLIDAFFQAPPSTPPSIIIQPQDQTVPTGSNAVLFVTAIGSTPLSYVWSFNGINLQSATNASLLLANVQPNQAGDYSVQVTNAFGVVTSSNAALTVEPPIPPVVVGQPQNQTVSVDGLAIFSVVVTGTPPTYQWTFNGNAISNATNSSFQLFDVQSSNAGFYAVAVTNAGGWAVSSNALLTVLPLGNTCLANPNGLVGWWAAEGDTYNAVDGTYGQLEGGLNFVPGEVGQAFNFNGIDADVKTPPSTNLNLTFVPNGFSIEAWINPADVATNHPLVEWGIPFWPQNGLMLWISIDPTNGGGGPGSLVLDIPEIPFIDNFLATPPGLITANTWQHVAATYDKTSGIASLYIDGSLITETNFGPLEPWSTEYLLFGLDPVLPDVWGAQYRYVGQMDEIAIYNRGLSMAEIQADYNAATYGMCPLAPTTVSIQPTNQTSFAGSNAAFTAFGSGTPPLSYQWSFDGTNIPGATSSTLAFTNLLPAQTGAYAVQVINSAGSLASANVFMTVLPSYPAWNPTTAPALDWTGLACSADGMKIVAVSESGQIYTSTNFGITWISNNAPALTWESAACSSDGTKIVAGAETLSGGPTGGIYGSTNSGATWQSLTNTLWSHTVCSADGNTLIFSPPGNVCISTNFGASWITKSSPAGITACSADATTLVCGNGKTVFVSTNFGTTWNSGVTLTTSNDTSGVACSTDGTKLYCGVFGGYFNSSTNSGNNWTALSDYGNWDAVACSASGAKLAIIRDFGLAGASIFTSSDSGITRSPANVPTNNWVRIASSADGNKLVAAGGYPSGPIYTWQIPTLYASFSGNQLCLSWFTNAAGFTLQQCTELTSTNWMDITNNITVTNWFNQLVLSPSGSSFYRLKYH